MELLGVGSVEGSVCAIQVKTPNTSCPLIVTFGAVGPRPLFSMEKLTRPFGRLNKIFIRDTQTLFYQAGLSPYSTTIPETVTFLRELINEMNPSKIVFCGNSMGGYGAILFGVLLNVNEIHAFAPLIDLSDPEYIGEKKQLRKMHKKCQSTYFNLDQVVRNRTYDSKINIYYDSTYPRDQYHSEKMLNLHLVKLHQYHSGEHDLIKELRSSGELKEIIVTALTTA